MAWQVTAASQVGSSHHRKGEPCADNFTVRQSGSTLILAIADGAGSALFGADGAKIASRNAVEVADSFLSQAIFPPQDHQDTLRQILVETLAKSLVEIDRLCVEREGGAGRQIHRTDFHATLLVAILFESSLIAGNIGDGWLIARDGEGRLWTVAPPQRGEYCNETFFLTSEDSLQETVIEVIPAANLDAIALMTDGTAWFAVDLEARRPSESLFAKLFAFAADSSQPEGQKEIELAAFLSSEAVCRKTDDDKTLVLAVRVPDTLIQP